jgi:hypothetical protein
MADKSASGSESLKDVTFRDFAALEFMKALITTQGVTNVECDAKRAYGLADALIDERDKREEFEAEVAAALNT